MVFSVYFVCSLVVIVRYFAGRAGLLVEGARRNAAPRFNGSGLVNI